MNANPTHLILILTILGLIQTQVHARPHAEKTYSQSKDQSEAIMDELVKQVNDEGLPKGQAILDLLKKASARKSIIIKKVATSPVEDIYNYARERTYQITTPYNCGKCDKWHGSNATAWALSTDGLIVTNYHCFLKIAEVGIGIVSSDSEFYPLEDILIADKDADFVIFKVKLPTGKTIKAFPLGQPAHRGDEIHLVSHLIKKPYYYSKGYVSGYETRNGAIDKTVKPVLWMQTELGYNAGSSGGGILNDQGEIVGTVSFVESRFKEVSPRKIGDKYAAKIFEYTVPVSTIKKRLQYEETD